MAKQLSKREEILYKKNGKRNVPIQVSTRTDNTVHISFGYPVNGVSFNREGALGFANIIINAATKLK